MARDIINFRAERGRHEQLLGREDVLAELDRFLLGGQGGRGWMLVKGGPGMGKSAILAHYLARLEKQGRQVPHHFLRRGVEDWDRPEVVARNLAAQVEKIYSEQVDAEARPESRLREILQRVSDEVLVPKGERLLLMVDGLDEAEPGPEGRNPLPRFLPHVLPPGVFILCASRPTYPHLDWLEAQEQVRSIDLDNERWANSNEDVVRSYWKQLAPHFDPPLAPEFIEEAVHRANGNVLYAARLSRWLMDQPAERRRVELLPKGLDAFLVEVWQRLHDLSKNDREVAFEGLGLIAAAREALPLSVLTSVAGWQGVETGERFLRATRPFLLKEPEHWAGGESAWRPFHESFRSFIATRLGTDGMRREYRKLAEHLCAWPVQKTVGEFRRRYALRHGVTHWLDAGDLERARTLCTDIGYLEGKCQEIGVTALEEDLSRVALVGTRDAQAVIQALHRAVQAESHWLRKAPEALALLAYNRLRSSGWTGKRIEETLHFPKGLPALRLRHPVRMGGNAIRTLVGHSKSVFSCAVTPDGRQVISASGDGFLKIWDLEAGRPLLTLKGHEGPVFGCTVTPDGKRVISASDDRTLRVWELETGQCLSILSGHSATVSSCVVTPDGERVVSASTDKTLKVWDLRTGKVLNTLKGHEDHVRSCAVTPDGSLVISASNDRTLKVWNLATYQAVTTLRGHGSPVRGCAVTPDGRRAISTSKNGVLKIWDLKTGESLATVAGQKGFTTGCAVTPDGRRAIAASKYGTLKIWDLESHQSIAVLDAHEDSVFGCAVTPEGRRAISASRDGTLKVWNLDTASRPLTALEGHETRVLGCSVTPDGLRAVSASADKTLKTWDLKSGRHLATLEGHNGPVLGCAVTPDGKRVLSASADRLLKEWEIGTGKLLTTLKGHGQPVISCVVTTDGRRVVSASADRTLKVWDIGNGQPLVTLNGHEDSVRGCTVTPDGRRGISASADKTLRLWDLETGRSLATWTDHESAVRTCAVTPNAKRVVSASKDTTLKVWNLDTGQVLATMKGHEGPVRGCAVLPDGRRVISASDDGMLKVWDIESAECLQTLYGISSFTCVASAKDVVCAGDNFGNVWILEASSVQRGTKQVVAQVGNMDLGIIIALKEEFRVFLELLPTNYRSERDEKTGQYDYMFELPDLGRRCVVTFIGEMNPEPAALHTERLIDKWNPRTVVMLGIAAGVHPDVRVGDVVVANQVDNYLASAKAQPGATPDDYDFALGGVVYQGDHDFITRVRNLEFAEQEAFTQWSQRCEESLNKVTSEEARARLLKRRLVRAVPELLDVHLASGPVVGAALGFTRWLREKRDRNLKALDMESAGLMSAAIKRVEPKRTLVIRGISDYGDERKAQLDAVGEGALRRYAMHNATEFLWALLRAGVLPSA